jgi:peptidoglycan/xylan/chitin deacetylase (PgdA/CDA1 family)
MVRNPEAVAAMNEAGWEVASHGYKWIDYKNVSEAEESRHIHEAIQIHTKVAGSRPLGFYQGKASTHTARLVMEEGGFVYSSDSYADDVPLTRDPSGREPEMMRELQ